MLIRNKRYEVRGKRICLLLAFRFYLLHLIPDFKKVV